MTQPDMTIPREEPLWLPLANDLIARLRLHHADRDHLIADVAPSALEAEMAADENLSAVFARFQKDQADALQHLSEPWAPIPARQILTAMRLAAAFGSISVLQDAQQSRAVTIVTDITLSDLDLVNQVLKGCFPTARWTLLSPGISDGAISKTSAARFQTSIEVAMDAITPTLILVPAGVEMPDYLRHADLPCVRLPSVTRDIVVAHLRTGDLGHRLTDEDAFRQALPDDAQLASLDTDRICMALRTPVLDGVIKRLSTLTQADNPHVPRLEEMTGDTPALMAARRLVADLQLWKQGTVAWSELSRSILFYGPPGTGKTWIARAMGASAGIACVAGSFAEWQAAGHLGDMLREMRKTFAEARRLAPSILFIDEIDAVGSRDSRDSQNSNCRTQVINGFLGEMNSIAIEEGVIVVGACNNIDRIDPAVLRAGRFDIKCEVPMPDATQILDLLRRHLRDDIADPDLCALSHAAVGRSPATIDAAIRAARSEARHRREALSLRLLQDKLAIETGAEHRAWHWRVAVHEAGHAIVDAALRLGTITSMKITDNGGEICRASAPSESLLSDLEATICYSLAGRAAERLVFGVISAGAGGPAGSDLARATEDALAIETVYGLGSEGPVWHDAPGVLMLKNDHLRGRVRQRIERAEVRAGKILAQHREALDALARDLLQVRSLNSAQIQIHLRDIPALHERATAASSVLDQNQSSARTTA